jgi:hypothetical protein
VRRFKTAVVAVALIFSIGLQWPILQSIAWVNMIVSYSQADGFETAVVKTFSGKHPCKICHVVKAGQEAEQQQAKEISLKKIDLISEIPGMELFAPVISIPQPAFATGAELLFDTPPTPPPDLV